jgi:hypothetical protein
MVRVEPNMLTISWRICIGAELMNALKNSYDENVHRNLHSTYVVLPHELLVKLKDGHLALRFRESRVPILFE